MTNKKSTLEVVIDSTGAKQGADAVIRAYDRMSRSASSFSKMSSASVTKSFSSILNSMKSLSASVAAGWKKMGDGVSYVKGKISSLMKFMGGLKTNITAIFGFITGGAIAAGVGALTTAGLRMQKFRTTLSIITGSSAEANKELEWLMNTVTRVGISFEQSAEPFARFAAASTEIFDKNEIREIFSAFSEASAALHLNQQEINGVFLALQQMSSKGKVSMEELRLQLAERIPGAMRVAADSMNMSVAELEDNIRKRMLSAEDFLVKFAKGIHDKFGDAASIAAATALGAFADLRNQVFKAKVIIAEAGLLDALGDGATRLAQYLRENTDVLSDIGAELAKIVRATVDWMTGLTKEDVRAIFVSVRDTVGQLYSIFQSIGNSAFFKWLAGPSSSEALTKKIELASKRLEATQILFNNQPVNVKGTSIQNLLIKKMQDYRQEISSAKKELSELSGSSDTKLLSTSEVSAARQSKSEGPSISESDYEEQLKATLKVSRNLLDANYELNELTARRVELQERAAKFLSSANDNSGTLTMQQRVKEAVKYKGVLLELRDVNEKLGREQAKHSAVQRRSLAIQNAMQRLSAKAQDDSQKKIKEMSNSVMILSEREQEQYDIKQRKEDALFKLKQSYQTRLNAVAGDAKGIASLSKAYDDASESITSSYDKMSVAATTTRDITESAAHGMKQAMSDYVDSNQTNAEKMADLFNTSMKGMEDSLVTFVQTGKLSFKDLADSIIADLVRMSVKQGLSSMVGAASGGSGLFGSIASGAAGLFGGSSASSFGSLFGSSSSSIQAVSSLGGSSGASLLGSASMFGGMRASGGPVEDDKYYVVGEKGPELFAPGKSGSIVPNDKLTRAKSRSSEEEAPPSNTNNYYYNLQVSTPDANSFRRSSRQIRDSLLEES